MKAKLQRRLQDLLTSKADDPEGTYDGVVDIFSEVVGEGLVIFFRIAEVDGQFCYEGSRYRRATAEEQALLASLEGRPVMSTSTLDFCDPKRREINQFRTFMTSDQDRETSIYSQFLLPFGIHSSVRVMAYRGDEFVGWLGCFRRQGERDCSRKLEKKLNALGEPIVAALCAADKLHRRRLISDDNFAIFDRAGELKFSSPAIRDFMEGERTEMLRQMVRTLEQEERAKSFRIIGGVEVRLVRLEGADGVRLLAQFSPPKVPSLVPLATLTPAQREVAEQAVLGSTNAEIAESTGRSAATVKVHLGNIYQQLGVANRVELTKLLRDN